MVYKRRFWGEKISTNMLRFTLVSLVFLVCAANANLLDSIVGKKVVVVTEEETEKVGQ